MSNIRTRLEALERKTPSPDEDLPDWKRPGGWSDRIYAGLLTLLEGRELPPEMDPEEAAYCHGVWEGFLEVHTHGGGMS